MLLGCFGTSEPEFSEYTVVRGDTLFVIARDHGVSLDELKQWNELDGDLIEVGDVLRIYGHQDGIIAGSTRNTKGRKKRRSSKSSASPTGGDEVVLPTPRAHKCLAGPSGDGLGDEGAVASVGLSREQVKQGMNGIINFTLRCVPPTTGRVVTDITVGCNGLVTDVTIDSSGPYDQAAIDCIIDTIEHAQFDAHQLPDGMNFGYPLVFNF